VKTYQCSVMKEDSTASDAPTCTETTASGSRRSSASASCSHAMPASSGGGRRLSRPLSEPSLLPRAGFEGCPRGMLRNLGKESTESHRSGRGTNRSKSTNSNAGWHPRISSSSWVHSCRRLSSHKRRRRKNRSKVGADVWAGPRTEASRARRC
jgi:hypothetical protein